MRKTTLDILDVYIYIGYELDKYPIYVGQVTARLFNGWMDGWMAIKRQ